LEFWELLGWILVTPDQLHVIVSPPKLIDLLKPLVHHQSFSKIVDTGQAQTVVENFDLLSFDVQQEIRQKFKLLEKRYILDVMLLERLKCWAPMNENARAQALRMLKFLKKQTESFAPVLEHGVRGFVVAEEPQFAHRAMQFLLIVGQMFPFDNG
jgi:hypothetical protein